MQQRWSVYPKEALSLLWGVSRNKLTTCRLLQQLAEKPQCFKGIGQSPAVESEELKKKPLMALQKKKLC